MKRIALTLMAILLVAYPMFSQIVIIPDTAFLHALIEEGVDTNGDSLISYTEAEAIISLWIAERGITDLKGIEAFIKLDTLDCSDNGLISLDISNCVDLKTLDISSHCSRVGCFDGTITSLDISKNTSLVNLDCGGNLLTSLDASNNTELESISCLFNQLSSLDVSNCTALTRLVACTNLITSLDLSNCSALSYLELDNMPTLYDVCVWEAFLKDSANIKIITWNSPNIYYTTECIIGIGETKHLGLSIYPNPTNDLLTIETDLPDQYYININSLNGQLIFSTKMEGSTHQVDLSSFPKGVYCITIRSKDFVTTRKIIKL